MKKVLIGCGIAMVLGIIVVVAAGVFVFRGFKGIVAEGAKLNDQYKATNAEYPFKAPSEDAIDIEQLDRWLGVRKKLTPALKDFATQMKDQKGPLAAFNTVKTHTPAIVDAHVKALREQKMSFEEYFWVARRVFTALQSGDAIKDPDLKDVAAVIGKFQSGQNGQRNGQANQFHVPMTSAAIVSTLASLKERKQDLLDTADATIAEMMIGPMIEQISTGGRSGSFSASVSSGSSSATTSTQTQ